MKKIKHASLLMLIVLCTSLMIGCGSNEKEVTVNNANDEEYLDDLQEAKNAKQTAINQTKTHIQRKIPKSKVDVDLSTNKEDLVVMVDIKMTSNNVNEAKSLAKQYVESLVNVPVSVARYDFTFVHKGKMVCMITKEKGVDKLSVFVDGKTSEY